MSAKISLDQAREYVAGLEMFGMRLGLERVRALAARLGDPQKSFRTVHVVGTNGKSSTTRFISAILQEHGLHVGTYVSPHLVSLAERQLVDGVASSDEEFYSLVAKIMPMAAKVEAGFKKGEVLTQFEVLTVAAYLHFKESKVDVAVVEAGLGGRWDATSIIESDVQVITSVALEHTEHLGETTLAILEEKAAVIPEGGVVVAGTLDDDVAARLRAICAERGAAIHALGEEISLLADVRQDSFDVFGVHGLYTNLRLSVLGNYQRSNAAVAIGAAELFLGAELDAAKTRTGLFRTAVPGRLEVISEQPFCVLDGAHNPAGMAEMLRSLDPLLARRRLLAVVSILRDKGALEMLRDLAPRCDIVFVTQNSNPRSYPAEELAAILEGLDDAPEVFVDRDPESAVRSAFKLATSNQVVIVTGSLYLISDLKRSMQSA